MEKFKWAFIGAGNIANKTAKELLKTNRHEIVSVYSRGYKKAQKFGNKFFAKVCGSLEECVLESNVQCVYIATPHSVHYEQVKKCLLLNKNVLCEKSITVNHKQLEELIKIAQDRNLYFCEAMWMRFNPIIKEISKIIKNGEIGEIQKMKSEFSYFAYLPFIADRVKNKNMAGGALLDLGVYTVSFAEMFFGYTDDIDCEVRFKNGCDYFDKAVLNYGNFSVTCLSAFTKFSKCSAKIVGSKGKIIFPFLFYKPQRCKIVQGKTKKIIKCKRAYIYEFDAVMEDIINGKKENDLINLNSSLNVMKMMDIIRNKSNYKYSDKLEKVY